MAFIFVGFSGFVEDSMRESSSRRSGDVKSLEGGRSGWTVEGWESSEAIKSSAALRSEADGSASMSTNR